MIRAVYHGHEPKWPASAQHPDAVRYGPIAIDGMDYWADCIGGRPTEAEIRAVLNPPKREFMARELFAALTPTDYAAIRTAAAQSDEMGLLWAALQAQGSEPISLDSARFKRGWQGMIAALGKARAAEIAAALQVKPE
jgi:hypothetical protein